MFYVEVHYSDTLSPVRGPCFGALSFPSVPGFIQVEQTQERTNKQKPQQQQHENQPAVHETHDSFSSKATRWIRVATAWGC